MKTPCLTTLHICASLPDAVYQYSLHMSKPLSLPVLSAYDQASHALQFTSTQCTRKPLMPCSLPVLSARESLSCPAVYQHSLHEKASHALQFTSTQCTRKPLMPCSLPVLSARESLSCPAVYQYSVHMSRPLIPCSLPVLSAHEQASHALQFVSTQCT